MASALAGVSLTTQAAASPVRMGTRNNAKTRARPAAANKHSPRGRTQQLTRTLRAGRFAGPFDIVPRSTSRAVSIAFIGFSRLSRAQPLHPWASIYTHD